MPPRTSKDPLAPVETITTALLGFVGGALVVFAVLAGIQLVTGKGDPGMSVATIGDREACVTTTGSDVLSGVWLHGRGVTQAAARPDISDIRLETAEVCLDEPSFTQKAAQTLEPVGFLVLSIGSLALILVTTRTGRRDGLFTVATARRVQRLGWFILAMTAVYPFVAAAGRGVVLQAALDNGYRWTSALWQPHSSWSLIVTGCGLVTVARVLQRAVLLQQDADATV